MNGTGKIQEFSREIRLLGSDNFDCGAFYKVPAWAADTVSHRACNSTADAGACTEDNAEAEDQQKVSDGAAGDTVLCAHCRTIGA